MENLPEAKIAEELVPKKRGRPSCFNETLAGKILELAQEGKTDAQIAKSVGVSVRAFAIWKSSNPDFLHALKECKDVADQLVEATLFQRACGYSHKAIKFFTSQGVLLSQVYDEHHPPDVTAAIFWLKNRQPEKWRDVRKHEVSNPDGSMPGVIIMLPDNGRDKK